MSGSRVSEDELGSWLASMGIADQFSTADLESGRTVANLIGRIDASAKVELQEGASAVARVGNWNAIVERLKSMGVKVSQEEKGKIINGSHDVVFRIISRLKQLHQKNSKQTQINLKDVDPRKDISQADSLLELFLLSVIRHFGLSPKEALSLLANDSKYLAHILAKGLKGQFRPIEAFIVELRRELTKIIGFCRNKENETFFLRAIKPALISKSLPAAENTISLLNEFLSEYDVSDRAQLLKEHLLGTMVLVVRRHPSLADTVMKTALNLSLYDPTVLNDIVMNTGKGELSMTTSAVWRAYYSENREEQLANDPAFEKALVQIHTNLKDPDVGLGSLSLLTEIAGDNFDIFNGMSSYALAQSFGDISPEKDNDLLVLVHLSAALLKITGDEKHPIAPMLFKFLTSKLITSTGEEYESVVTNLGTLIEQIPTIPPLHILQHLSQRSEVSIGQLELGLFGKIMSLSPEPKSAVAIYNMVSRCLVEEEGLGFEYSRLLVRIISAFRDEEIIADMTIKLVKVCLAIFFANVKKLTAHRKPISHKNKMDPDELAGRLKLLQLEDFIRRVVMLKDDELNNHIEPLLCLSYSQVVSMHKQQAKQYEDGLKSIIELIGPAAQLVAKYEVQLGQSNVTMKQSKVSRQQSPPPHASPQIGGSPASPYEYGQDSGYPGIKATKRVKSSHPQSLTLTGVKQDAYSGLEKYTKMHQKKVLAAESKRYQALQAIEDQKKSKKVHERKIALQRGLRIRSVAETQLQYLFEFGSKDSYAEANSLHLNVYSHESEETRDITGLEHLLRRYQKALRVYFHNYSGKKVGQVLQNFDEYLDKKSFVHSSNIVKMLKDHGLESYITPKEIKALIRKINYRLKKVRDDPEVVDFEAFKDLILQMAFTMYTRPPKDLRGHPVAEMLEELFSNLKAYATENRVSLQLFEEPEVCYHTEAEAVKVLNAKLQQNPDYILPEGYKKLTEKKVFYDYQIYLQAMSPTYKTVYEVVDEMLYDALGFHVIEPFTQEQTIVTARPNIYHLDRNKFAETVGQKHIPISLKKEVAKVPIHDRITAREAASALGDIIQAIQMNHDEIGQKHENWLQREKREREEEERRQREARDKKLSMINSQFKESMTEYKTVREEKEEAKKQKKRDEEDRLRQLKEQKEQRNQELKRKVEEYMQRKKEDEEAKKESEKSKIQRDKQEFERKKREIEETKSKIAELKKQKSEQEQERKEKQKDDERRRRAESKRKEEEEKREKKRRIEEYRTRKLGQSKVMDAAEQEEVGGEEPVQ